MDSDFQSLHRAVQEISRKMSIIREGYFRLPLLSTPSLFTVTHYLEIYDISNNLEVE